MKRIRGKSKPQQAPALAIDSPSRVAELERQLRWATLRIQMLEQELRQERIAKLGPKSETLSNLQLQFLCDEEPGVSVDEVEAEAHREPFDAPKPPATPDRERSKKKHPGRERLPEHLERVEQIIPCADRSCASCGQETELIGYDESEQLAVVPAKHFVRVTLREKRACRCCEKGGVAMAPLPERIIEKSMASDELVISTVIGKYCDHLPLYRQAAILEREAGVEISRVTLDGWVMRVGEMLEPVVAGMRRDLLACGYLQADETPVPVQTREARKGSNHEAYLWQYGKPGGETVFDFRMGRDGEGPRRFLGEWEGILQTDGYQAYESVGGPKIVHAGCWAHARRKFVDAVKVNEKDTEAAKMVVRMDALFVVDRETRKAGLSVAERMALRQEHVTPWVREIRKVCQYLVGLSLPQSALGKACRYTLNQWAKLNRFLEYEEIELSNNLAENSMRPVALGRKNWLHVGSQKAGPKVAAILSVVESCRRLGVPVREYLAAVLPGLQHRTTIQASKLTPARWAASLK